MATIFKPVLEFEACNKRTEKNNQSFWKAPNNLYTNRTQSIANLYFHVPVTGICQDIYEYAVSQEKDIIFHYIGDFVLDHQIDMHNYFFLKGGNSEHTCCCDFGKFYVWFDNEEDKNKPKKLYSIHWDQQKQNVTYKHGRINTCKEKIVSSIIEQLNIDESIMFSYSLAVAKVPNHPWQGLFSMEPEDSCLIALFGPQNIYVCEYNHSKSTVTDLKQEIQPEDMEFYATNNFDDMQFCTAD